jgi:hypothetical protein
VDAGFLFYKIAMLRDVLKGIPVYTNIQEEYVLSILMTETAGVFHKIFFCLILAATSAINL